MVFPNDQPGVSPIIEYLGHHPVRPKEEIGRAMAALGFNVPTMFEGLDNAIASRRDFIARSEGPDELYHSGLKLSLASTHPRYSEELLRDYATRLADPGRSYASLTGKNRVGAHGIMAAELWRMYAANTGSDTRQRDEFARLHSLSFWQLAAGDNFYIVGDTANSGKQYIGRTTPGKRSFSTIEDGALTAHYPSPWDSQAHELPNVKKLSEFYTDVRSAAPFDTQNAAIVECSDAGKDQDVQFLQYLPTQPFLGELPKITSSQSDVLFVRGATPPAGIRGYMAKNSDQAAAAIQKGKHPIITEGFDPFSVHLSEFVLPRADVSLIHPIAAFSRDHFTEAMGLNTIDHGGRSLAFKPKVTIALSKTAMDFLERRQQERPYQPIPLHIRADGIHAEVRASLGDRVVELHRLMDQVHENSGF